MISERTLRRGGFSVAMTPINHRRTFSTSRLPWHVSSGAVTPCRCRRRQQAINRGGSSSTTTSGSNSNSRGAGMVSMTRERRKQLQQHSCHNSPSAPPSVPNGLLKCSQASPSATLLHPKILLPSSTRNTSAPFIRCHQRLPVHFYLNPTASQILPSW